MTIEKFRNRIDNLDKHLAELLAARACCVAEIQKIKRQQGLDIPDQNRESEVLKKLLVGKTELEKSYIEAAYRSLFEAGRKL